MSRFQCTFHTHVLEEDHKLLELKDTSVLNISAYSLFESNNAFTLILVE